MNQENKKQTVYIKVSVSDRSPEKGTDVILGWNEWPTYIGIGQITKNGNWDIYGDLSDWGIPDYWLEVVKDHTAPLREELEKLRAWKESAMKTLGVVDLQECGKLLNIGLGQSIADKIVPGIKELRAENEEYKSDTDRRIKGYNDLHDDLIRYRDKYDQSVQDLDELKAENERLENIIIGYTSSLKDYDVERKHLINENQKLREALEDIASDMGNYLEIAKEALKGGCDET